LLLLLQILYDFSSFLLFFGFDFLLFLLLLPDLIVIIFYWSKILFVEFLLLFLTFFFPTCIFTTIIAFIGIFLLIFFLLFLSWKFFFSLIRLYYLQSRGVVLLNIWKNRFYFLRLWYKGLYCWAGSVLTVMIVIIQCGVLTNFLLVTE